MPRLDLIHHAVKTALLKEGWTITDDPYILKYRRTTLYADLGVERAISVQRHNQKLVIEIKSFVGVSKIQDLKEALGQLDIYSYILEEIEPDRKLYLAVSTTTYQNIFQLDIAQLILKKRYLPLIIVDLETEEITQWIN
ncbi:element excision factor XisH family protein [Oscillatoria sp. HE19RPO]|jgi:hypothetical protein|uniref:element excision factor XisH family protein n=1 Tax=Oscillatoria sp. HE19RPO TaxID=2954806 RepID=UPI0020C2F2E5|nr:element excision factor XisH family protein [Oscillatoria sp. HE19RPO]